MVEIGHYSIDYELISIVATPIISLIAVIIYAQALRNSNKQNEVLLSQNIKPNFEKEIDGILKDGKKIGHILNVDSETSEKKSIDKIHIFDAIFHHIRRMSTQELKIDKEQKKNLTEEYLQTRSYWNDIYQIRHIINSNSLSVKYYKNIENFLENLENSRMINEDKYSIKNNLRRKVLRKPLKSYHAYFLNLNINELEIPMFVLEKHKLEWQKISNSELFKSIVRIEEFLSRP